MMNSMKLLFEAFQYDFIIKAIFVGTLIAICCAILGVFLVLKKYSMIGDGLAHVSFASIAIALFFSASPLLVSIPIVIFASFVIIKLNEKADIHGDAAIGLVSSFSIAVGVIIASLAKGFNVDLMSYLFGSILIISDTDAIISMVLAPLVIGTIFFFYNSLVAITYNEEFAQVLGLNTKRLNYVIAILTSVTITLGIRIVGTMLISSLIIFPAVSALQISKGFKSTLILATFIAILCVVIGVLLSFVWDLPSGATIVMLNALCFVLVFGIKKFKLR